MSTETKELNRLFNNISGGTVDLKLSQTKWLQMINEWIEENGIGGGGGDGSSYKGVTLLDTGTLINTGEESPTTYEFCIYSEDPISSIEEYWGNEYKPCLLINTLDSEEVVLTPVTLSCWQDDETGVMSYAIETRKGGYVAFSSVEIKDQSVIVAYLKNKIEFTKLEKYLKVGSLIQSGSGDVIADEPLKLIAGTGMTSSGIPGGNSSSSHFRFSIAMPRSIIEAPSAEKLSAYLNGAKLCYWTDESDGTEYLDFISITFSEQEITFNFNDNSSLAPLQSGGDPDSGVMYFDFDGSAKEIFVQNALNGSSGGSSSGPNYQVPYGGSATLEISPIENITVKKFEVAEEYKLLKLTYQRVSEEVEPPEEEKVFSIMCENENGTGENYYVIWDIDSEHYANKMTESGTQQSNIFLENYPVIVCISYKYKE